MKNSRQGLDLIHPGKLNKLDGIQACFSRKNADLPREDHRIPGLNLGMNTPDRAEVIGGNRKELLAELDMDHRWVAYAEQVHGTRVLAVTEGATYAEADGLVTTIPGLALAIQVADCAAVLLADPVNRVIGAIHAGWRGAAGEILDRGIKKMKRQGAEPSRIFVFISPCICRKHFEVGREVAEQFPDKFVDNHSFEKPHVDLKEFLVDQAQSQGVPLSRITVHPDCTIGDSESYYSYRREGEQAGRMLGLIRMAEM